MEHQEFTNFAFISYKREDEKWAKWLQRKLESYKIPAIIREGKPELPESLRPVFRDGTDLSGGILAEQLNQELLRSKFLIVICSPEATRSTWVNKEVQAFVDEGRVERIIPFIIAGIPHADSQEHECFPQALLQVPAEKELLGINVQEVGKSRAFIRLVATMLCVRFDTLWQRHRRAFRKRCAIYGTAALLLLSAGLFYWDYTRPTYRYFVDYVDCYGVPEGILPLTEKQVSRRGGSYLFQYRRIPIGEPKAYTWRVVKVSYVNSALRPVTIGNSEWRDRSPVQEIEYNRQTGAVSRINFCDTKGKVLLRHVLSERNGVPAAVADFISSREERGVGFAGASLANLSLGQLDARQQKANIVRFVYERDASGHIVRQTFHSNNDYDLSRSAIPDADGIFGFRYGLDSLGRRIQVENLGFDGTGTSTRKGVSMRKLTYDSSGNLQKAAYYDESGGLVLNDELWAVSEDSFDENGNVIEIRTKRVGAFLCRGLR